MKIALGLYTSLSFAPPELFSMTLESVYRPVLSCLYLSGGGRITLYQSYQMMRYLQRERPDFKSLISSLTSRLSIDHLTGPWTQAVPSLMYPKERSEQIEKMTAAIRKEYGVRPSAAFLFGQIWQPQLIGALKNSGIDSVVLSTWKKDGEGPVRPFVMNELGRRENIYPFLDGVSEAVREYSEGAIGSEELERRTVAAIEADDADKIVFFNIDQLVLGSRREGKADAGGSVVRSILSRYSSVGLEEIPCRAPGYLPSGWYGRDADVPPLPSVRNLILENGSFRYMYNRYISLSDANLARNNRLLKKDVYTALFNVATGPLFIHDAQMAPLRYETRRSFWSSLIQAEKRFLEYTESPAWREYDWEETGRADIVMNSTGHLAVISPLGASLPEFDSLPGEINIFDTRDRYDRNIPSTLLRKSFSDSVVTEDGTFTTEDTYFRAQALDKKRSEVLFTGGECQTFPYAISKRFRMRPSTFIMDTVLENTTGEKIQGSYSVTVYLGAGDASLTAPGERMDMLAKGFVRRKTVKYSSRTEKDLTLAFTSVSTFTLTEEEVKCTETTALGDETFLLGKKLVFTFPLEAEGGESVTYRLAMRVGNLKKE